MSRASALKGTLLQKPRLEHPVLLKLVESLRTALSDGVARECYGLLLLAGSTNEVSDLGCETTMAFSQLHLRYSCLCSKLRLPAIGEDPGIAGAIRQRMVQKHARTTGLRP